MKSKPTSHQDVLCIGIDWGDEQHVVHLLPSSGVSATEKLVHEPEAIAQWVESVKRRFPQHRYLICLEQSRGALISALAEYDELELYPINPKQLSSYRDSVYPSGSKNDPNDAQLLAEFLRNYRDRLRAWKPDAVETRRLAELTEMRRKLVDERKRLVSQLSSTLKLYFPQLLTLFNRELHHVLILDLLRRWPTLQELKRVHPRTLRKFLAEHGVRKSEQQTELIKGIRSAVALTNDPAIIEARSQYAQVLGEKIKTTHQAIAKFDVQLRQLTVAHSDEPLFRALPGAGDVFVPRLIAALGSDRDRYQTADDIACYSGIAPVTKQSGKSILICKRIMCPKFLRQTFHEFAEHSCRWSEWAKAFYRMKRERGMKHHAALRALAFKWIRIIFRLWQTNTIYSEQKYLDQLRAKRSPIIDYLKTA